MDLFGDAPGPAHMAHDFDNSPALEAARRGGFRLVHGVSFVHRYVGMYLRLTLCPAAGRGLLPGGSSARFREQPIARLALLAENGRRQMYRLAPVGLGHGIAGVA